MPANAFASEPRNAMLRPYQPTWKEQIAALLMGDTRPSPERRQFAQGIADILGYLPGTGNVLQGQESAARGDTKGAMMAMLPLAPAARIPAQVEQQAVKQGIRAFHGSPHDFPAFDLSKIGTGEGAQVYGHGLYFAEHEPVAQKYRDALANTPDITKYWLKEAGGDKEKAAVLYRNYFGLDSAESQQFLRPEEIAAHERVIGEIRNPPGRMYEVNIKAEPEQFLDWDTPIESHATGQSILAKMDPALRARLEDRLDRAGFSPDLTPLTGRELHSLLVKESNENALAPGLMADPGQPEVAEYLRSLGIPGVKYQDAGSRGAANKTYNYVVNDDRLVEIMRKYGLMGAVGAGIAAKILARQDARQEM